MTYKIEQYVAKITSPIIVFFEDKETEYPNGRALADAVFEKPYLIRSISAKADSIIITIAVNDKVNDTTDLKQETFF